MIERSKKSTPNKPTDKSGPRPYSVRQPAELMTFLLEAMKGKSRTSIKGLLAHQMVTVNGRVVKQFNHQLATGDKVAIGKTEAVAVKDKSQLEVLFEDAHVIVINKPSGLLTIATDDEKQQTAYRMVSDHLKQRDNKARVFVLHRLDRDTSGVMMFAKSQEVQNKMQANWGEEVVNRQYSAVVEGRMKAKEGVLDNLLVEASSGVVFVSKQAGSGKRAITRFTLAASNMAYSLLNLTLETGRKNQIRVQLAHIGFPVCGDKKYGAKTNPLKRLALHAGLLVFKHPVTGEEMKFTSPVPVKFKSLAK